MGRFDGSNLTPLQAYKAIWDEYYEGCRKKASEGNLVAWCSGLSPLEILIPWDIVAIFPENHAAALGAKKLSLELCQVAEGEGYSTDICSYARANFGHLSTGKCAVGGIPKPDVMLLCNNTCCTITKWYEDIAKRLDVPVIFIDTPFNHRKVGKEAVAYIKAQLEDAVKTLEKLTGKKLDKNRFAETLDISNKTSQAWNRTLDNLAQKPAPITAFDAFFLMSPIVVMRGTQETLDYYEYISKETTRLTKEGLVAIPDEKHRILFDGIPFWFRLKETANLFKKHNTAVVAATYPSSWVLEFETLDLEGMAKTYTSVYINQNYEFKIKNLLNLVERFKVDGIIAHSNRSCKPNCFGQYAFLKDLEKRAGVPYIVVDGDQTDPRMFSEAQFETRVQAFLEVLDAKKHSA